MVTVAGFRTPLFTSRKWFVVGGGGGGAGFFAMALT